MSFRIWGLLLELRSMNTWVHPSRGLVDSWQCAIILVFENSARFGTSGLVFVIVLSVVDNCWRILFLAKDLSMIKQSTNTETNTGTLTYLKFLLCCNAQDFSCKIDPVATSSAWIGIYLENSMTQVEGVGGNFFESLTDYKSETLAM